MIKVLDQSTINKIAAGEVVERPSSVVKELVENAIDAGATAVTVEIKEGGMSFIRITDNGQGIEKDEVPTAFVRHATSKIMTIEDLLSVSSLGFRGEALASIAAVAQVECITKTAHSLTGIRYEIHGGKEIASEEIGAPTGTTIIVRNLFYNVPARKKFLKTAMTEGSYITELITRLALSHPEISFKYITNGSNKIATSGNGALKDVIYHIYGKDISANLLPIKRNTGEFSAEGYVGKSFVSKGNRSFEHYFVNGRYIRSNIITKAIEEAYKSFVMIHKFPFTSLHFTLDSTKLDVNVHPAKMEFKYAEGEKLFDFVKECVRQALLQDEMIPDVSLRTAKEQKAITIEQQRKNAMHMPEPFEKMAREKTNISGSEKTVSPQPADQQLRERKDSHQSEDQQLRECKDSRQPEHQQLRDSKDSHQPEDQQPTGRKDSRQPEHQQLRDSKDSHQPEDQQPTERKDSRQPEQVGRSSEPDTRQYIQSEVVSQTDTQQNKQDKAAPQPDRPLYGQDMDALGSEQSDVRSEPDVAAQGIAPPSKDGQITLPVEQFLSEAARPSHHLIGQLFRTYWLIEYDNKLYIMDQHAAHEKVMFERLMRQMSEKNVVSQQLLPPKVLHLDNIEHTLVMNQMELFRQTGFDLEDFGDDSIVIRSMPDDIMGVDPQQLFDALLNSLLEDTGTISLDFFVEKLSGMACKAAIKGNWQISAQEANALLDELLTLENPYNCPHGRPTMITLTKTELERKFKRIQN